MKKVVIGCIAVYIVTTFLCSCQVNWFDQHYDVSWWVIAVPVVIFSAIMWFVAGKYIASKKYVCPKCNQTFFPRWWKAAISVHINSDRVFRCPHCGKKGFCHLFKEDGK